MNLTLDLHFARDCPDCKSKNTLCIDGNVQTDQIKVTTECHDCGQIWEDDYDYARGRMDQPRPDVGMMLPVIPGPTKIISIDERTAPELAGYLISCSTPFNVVPYPGGDYRFEVKDEGIVERVLKDFGNAEFLIVEPGKKA